MCQFSQAMPCHPGQLAWAGAGAAAVVEYLRSTLAQNGMVKCVEVSWQGGGWCVKLYCPIEVLRDCRLEELLSITKRTLVEGAEMSSGVFVLGHASDAAFAALE